jgi:hypothetical protein
VDNVLAAYRAFNARDVDAALAPMAVDVDWPNAWEGGRAVGKQAVRAYWERQWAEIQSTVTPVEVVEHEDGRVAVMVHQVVHSPAGEELSDTHVLHVFEFDGDLVSRMDVAESESG